MRPTLLIALSLLVCASCTEKKAAATQQARKSPHAARNFHTAGGGEAGAPISGVVGETMNSGGYTYALINTGTGGVWTAAPQCSVSVGDTVAAINPMPMPNWESKTLKRTFDLVYFCGGLVRARDMAGGMAAMGQVAPVHGNAGTPGALSQIKVDFAGIEKPAGGSTIGDLYARKDKLAGTKVIVRGKVVKANNNIMGTNWVHLRDGTGPDGANDLTVTTPTELTFGQTVTVEGVLGKDKDIGAGYTFALIIENAKVTVDK